MNRRALLYTALAVLLLTAAAFAAKRALADDEKAEPKPQTTCPVMGGKINKELFVDHDSKRIYLCCPGCEAAVKKDPAKYIAKLEDDGITLDKPIKPQTTCPVMGGKINKELFVDHGGKRIYLCCPGCEAAVKKDPAKYIAKLEDDGITLDKPIKPQTTCP
ncbi:MAG: hypothetical protein HQ592_12640, partial [Planctomycetes bacterium]|nr:hypothetical protein [Planctomycetota bacterium]